ncbi:MAG: hypothetical protein KKC75_04440 [Nanoarchaeota archaeon]|nr:hypothetical protein [Nanoarchaeota archaeon]MBU1005334.1 hypothetical protein [Nanoarchaeota archaeon]MBU1945494.1 hypothetical protein [Nanoarchaeota archaeon]
MFDFNWRIKNAFVKVKSDIESLKQSSNDWIVFLDEKNNEAEKRLEKIEARIDRMEEAMLRVLSLR